MFRKSANKDFYESYVSKHSQHDHFGLYKTKSDPRVTALTNAVDHLILQAQCTGANICAKSHILVATGGRIGPALHVAKRSEARVTAISAVATDVDENSKTFDGNLNIVEPRSSEKLFDHDDATFDVVMSVDGMIGTADKKQAIEDSFRILKEGGLLVGMDVMVRPGAYQRNLAPFEKQMCVPPLVTFYAFEKLLEEAGFVLMRTSDLSPHIFMSYMQVIENARSTDNGGDDCSPEIIQSSISTLESDVDKITSENSIAWTSYVALKPHKDKKNGKLVID